jgi:hypothetical protein
MDGVTPHSSGVFPTFCPLPRSDAAFIDGLLAPPASSCCYKHPARPRQALSLKLKFSHNLSLCRLSSSVAFGPYLEARVTHPVIRDYQNRCVVSAFSLIFGFHHVPE